MPSTKPKIINLCVQINHVEFVLGMLSFSTQKKEMSFHFKFPIESSQNHLFQNTMTKQPRLDHITWHKSVINIKRIDDKRLQQITRDFIPANYELDNNLTPILVECFI